MNRISLLSRDLVVKATSTCGQYRAAAVSVGQAARQICRGHQDHISVQKMAQTMALTNMLASFLNHEERVEVTLLHSSGRCTCESLALGETRGFLDSNHKDSSGILRVRRVLYERMQPVDSVVQLETDDVSKLSEHFFKQSEGIPTAVLLLASFGEASSNTVLESDVRNLTCAGGIMFQPIVSSPENVEVVREVQENFLKFTDSFDPLIQRADQRFFLFDLFNLVTGNSQNTDSILARARHIRPADLGLPSGECAFPKPTVDFDVETVVRTPIDFLCRCSKANFLHGVKALGKESLQRYKESCGEAMTFPVSCRYCHKKYDLTVADFDTLLDEASSKPAES